ncbi:hypothetical protein U9M48_028735 [Paspalum notatum var. saurae]|uniref:Uncharacterized protein n=1 Tax=Paspalum notatum var. saurae TaxID=547442 RepID=A0AAQ3TXD6_PASNO
MPRPAVTTSNGVARQGNGEEHPQTLMMMTVDSVIFEEYDEDNEGYLLADQEEDTDEENDVEETQDDSSSVLDVPDLYDKGL